MTIPRREASLLAMLEQVERWTCDGWSPSAPMINRKICDTLKTYKDGFADDANYQGEGVDPAPEERVIRAMREAGASPRGEPQTDKATKAILAVIGKRAAEALQAGKDSDTHWRDDMYRIMGLALAPLIGKPWASSPSKP